MSRHFATGCTAGSVFVIADLHLGDEATCGSSRRKQRRPFADAGEMSRELVRRWNDTVSGDDTVYLLGDVGRRSHLRLVEKLHGRKHLVAGNGDDLNAIIRSGLFLTVTVARWLPGFMLTHIPVHPDQLPGRTINVHGHLHGLAIADDRYRCVSVEQTNFAPVRLDELRGAPDRASL